MEKEKNKILNTLIANFKDVVIGCFIILVCIFAYNWWQNSNENKRLYGELIGHTETYKQLTESLAQLQTTYVEQNKLIIEQKNKFEELIKEKDDRIKSLTEAVFTHKSRNRKLQGSELQYIPSGEYGKEYHFNEVRISGPDSPPLGWVMISEDGTVRSGTYKFDIEVEQLQTIDEKTGKTKIYSQAYYVALQNGLANRSDNNLKHWKDIRYPLNIKGGEALIDPTQLALNMRKRFFLWAPRFGMGVNAGVYGGKFKIKPNLNFSVSGYGVSKRDLDFRFLEFGVGMTHKLKDVDIHVKPVMWRPFKKVLPNTYIGPGISYSPSTGNYGFFGGLSVSF